MADARADLDMLLRAVQQESKAWSSARMGSRLSDAIIRAANANDVGIDVVGALEELQAAWHEATDPHGELSGAAPEPEE